ncbi:MAG: DUF59 domain-containing protein [Gammaproteobacteria bacterium]|nr:DUF59 domain-containing protein [Gammaproteobacteria bacterium]
MTEQGNNEDDMEVPYREGMSESALETPIVEALRTVYDPEIPVSIFDLGLIYAIDIGDDGIVKVTMTLTAPTCPVAEEIPKWVQEAVVQVDGVDKVEIELVWDPFWKPEYMSEEANLMLNLM